MDVLFEDRLGQAPLHTLEVQEEWTNELHSFLTGDRSRVLHIEGESSPESFQSSVSTSALLALSTRA